MKVYISGAVASGENYKKAKATFDSAKKHLEDNGLSHIVTPYDDLNPEDAKNYLSGKFSDNLRKMIGCDAIYLLSGWWHSTTASIEHYSAKMLGKRILFEDERDSVRLDEIIAIVAEEYNVTIEDILSQSRIRNFVYCRQFIVHYLRVAGVKDKLIGKILNRDRTSVVHLNSQYDADITNNAEFKSHSINIEKKLNELGYFQRGVNTIIDE